MADLSEEELQGLYAWIDEIPLSRQKKNISRDFSDGVLAAEVVYHFLPKLVEQHNYSPANAIQQKVENWRTLNRKVFSRLNFSVPEDLLQGVATGKPGVIEFILSTLRAKIEHYFRNRAAKNFTNENEFVAPSNMNQSCNNEQVVSTFQIGPSFPWIQDGNRHTGAAESDHHHQDSLLSDGMNKTYPVTGSGLPPSFPSSRIPLPANKKTTLHLQHTSGQSAPLLHLPPLHSEEKHDTKPILPPVQRRRPIKYAHKVGLPATTNANNRDTSATVRIRLAEKDQRLLETQEYIQYLQMKLTRLEHLVHIKDMKIEELKKAIKTNTRQTLPFQR